VCVRKFYDENFDGINNDNRNVSGYRFRVSQGAAIFSAEHGDCVQVGAGDWVVKEAQGGDAWFATTPAQVTVTIPAACGTQESTSFGNLCIGPGNGHTLGFWSNRNGGDLIKGDEVNSRTCGSTDSFYKTNVACCLTSCRGVVYEMQLLNALNLVNANGSPAVFTADLNGLTAFRNFLLGATATNMANMLSAQLAAMVMNVINFNADRTQAVKVWNSNCGYTGGYVTLQKLLEDSNTLLASSTVLTAASATRNRADCLKTTLDRGNNDLNWVQRGSSLPSLSCPNPTLFV